MLHAREQVAQHLWRAERAARARDVSDLDPARRLLRSLLLYELARYRLRGRFPQNPDFAEPTPYFVDAAGTRCAVGHLLDLTGEHGLVRRIARQRNHARVRELADEPRLVAWLAAVGLTLDEAAAIQPAYLYSRADCVCGNDFQTGPLGDLPASGVIVGSVTQVNGKELRIRVESAEGNIEPYQLEQEIEAWAVSGGTVARVGDTVVVPVAPAGEVPQALRAAVLSNDEGYTCATAGATTTIGPLSDDQLTSALLTDSPESCRDLLASFNPAWGERLHASPEGGVEEGSHADVAPGEATTQRSQASCATSAPTGSTEPTPFGLLLVLASLIVARSRGRRAR